MDKKLLLCLKEIILEQLTNSRPQFVPGPPKRSDPNTVSTMQIQDEIKQKIKDQIVMLNRLSNMTKVEDLQKVYDEVKKLPELVATLGQFKSGNKLKLSESIANANE